MPNEATAVPTIKSFPTDDAKALYPVPPIPQLHEAKFASNGPFTHLFSLPSGCILYPSQKSFSQASFTFRLYDSIQRKFVAKPFAVDFGRITYKLNLRLDRVVELDPNTLLFNFYNKLISNPSDGIVAFNLESQQWSRMPHTIVSTPHTSPFDFDRISLSHAQALDSNRVVYAAEPLDVGAANYLALRDYKTGEEKTASIDRAKVSSLAVSSAGQVAVSLADLNKVQFYCCDANGAFSFQNEIAIPEWVPVGMESLFYLPNGLLVRSWASFQPMYNTGAPNKTTLHIFNPQTSTCCQSVTLPYSLVNLQLSHDSQTLFGCVDYETNTIEFLDLATLQRSRINVPAVSCVMAANGEVLIQEYIKNEIVHYKPEYMVQFENRACLPLRQAVTQCLAAYDLISVKEVAGLIGRYFCSWYGCCYSAISRAKPISWNVYYNSRNSNNRSAKKWTCSN